MKTKKPKTKPVRKKTVSKKPAKDKKSKLNKAVNKRKKVRKIGPNKKSKKPTQRVKSKSNKKRRSNNDIFLFTEDSSKILFENQEIVDNKDYASSKEEPIATNIEIKQSGFRSPHLVDLKKSETSPHSRQQPVSDRVSFEDRLAAWEARFTSSAKTNFITPQAVKQAKTISNKQPGRLHRFFIIISSKFGSLFDNGTSRMQKWSDDKITAYLAKLSDNNSQSIGELVSGSNDKENIELDIKDTSLNNLAGFNKFVFSRVTVSLIIFLTLALSLTLPIKAFTFYNQVKQQKSQVLGASTSVYQDFDQGLLAIGRFDFGEASNNFLAASEGLINVKEVIDEYPSFLISMAGSLPQVGSQIKTAQALVDAGNHLAQSGAVMSQMLEKISSDVNLKPTERLTEFGKGFKQMSYLLKMASTEINSFSLSDVPSEYKDKVSLLRQWLPVTLKLISRANQVIDLGVIFLGDESPQRYLLVFQNSNELRPTGGFMGTIAETDVNQGEVKNLFIPPGGIYDLQGSLEVLLASPKPLHMLNANWQMQDANWWFDFPTSAKKILWFYEKSGGPTVDGLIAVNSNLLPRFLAITGPIYLPEFDVTLDSENVISELQKEIEFGYDKELNQPKKIISSLAPILLERLQNLEGSKFLDLFNTVNQALASRDIQLYHSQEELEKKIESLGWAGRVRAASQDYLAVIDTNVGGNKTDNVIEQNYSLQTEINEAGEIVNHLKITRWHHGESADIFTGATNIDYLRVYVPEGSKLLGASGFYQPLPNEFSSPSEGFSEDEYINSIEMNPIVDEKSGTRITQEFGKTAFANWVKVEPGEKVEMEIIYKLPFSLEFKNNDSNNVIINYFDKLIKLLGVKVDEAKEVATYTAYWQKQSGQKPPTLLHELKVPTGWVVATSPNLQNKVAAQGSSVYYRNDLSQDDFWGVILSR